MRKRKRTESSITQTTNVLCVVKLVILLKTVIRRTSLEKFSSENSNQTNQCTLSGSYYITLQLGGSVEQLLVDTGAAVSVVPDCRFKYIENINNNIEYYEKNWFKIG